MTEKENRVDSTPLGLVEYCFADTELGITEHYSLNGLGDLYSVDGVHVDDILETCTGELNAVMAKYLGKFDSFNIPPETYMGSLVHRLADFPTDIISNLYRKMGYKPSIDTYGDIRDWFSIALGESFIEGFPTTTNKKDN